MSGAPPVQRFVVEVAPGQQVVGDLLDGNAPGYLYLHGMGSVRAGEKSASLFRHAAAHGRACARIDLRGHGESSGTIGRVRVGELVADTRRVLDRIGPAHVIGSSLGGIVAALVAAAAPEQVRSLALLAPALGFLPRLDRIVDARGWLWTSDGRGFPVAADVLAEAMAFDESGLPAALSMPVLLVHGTADDVVPHRASEQFHAAIPHAHKDLWIVPEGDHRLSAHADAIWQRFDRLGAGRA